MPEQASRGCFDANACMREISRPRLTAESAARG